MTTPAAMPAQLGRYRILEKIGAGGMGTVYLAEDGDIGRRVALKVPHFEANEGPGVIERFRREARVAGAIDHPHICPIYDVGAADGYHYLVMPFIEGTPLAQRIDPEHPWPVAQAVALVRQLALALEVLHQRGILHRDLKPANVMIRSNGEPVLMDFGLARSASQRLTSEGQAVGTPAYMSPEQVLGTQDDMGPGTDVYSLGVILYELVTGTVPFHGPLHAIWGQKLHGTLRPPTAQRPGLDPEVDALCLKALAKQVEDRYPSMAAFAQALQDYLHRGNLATTRPGPVPLEEEPEETRLVCPTCGKRLKLAPEFQGKRVKCPACQTRLGRVGEGRGVTMPAPELAELGQAPTPPPSGSQTRPFRARRAAEGWPLSRGGLLLACAVAGVMLVSLIITVLLPSRGGKGPSPADPQAQAQPERPREFAKAFTNSIGMKLVLIPAGKFQMGSPEGEKERDPDEFPHEVEITQPFHMGVFEVTQAEYQKIMGMNPSHFTKNNGGGPYHPVETVSWQDAKDFCEKLTRREENLLPKRLYRLPTEAEWEYACRGGARESTPFHFGGSLSCTQANFDGNRPYGNDPKGPYRQKTTPVGSYNKPNAFGLHDMHGNVWEWCADWYDDNYYKGGNRKDPQGPPNGTRRVLRGGSWFDSGGGCRSALRYCFDPGNRNPSRGFRVVCVGVRTP